MQRFAPVLLDANLLACTYVASANLVKLFQFSNGGAVAACYLRERVALANRYVLAAYAARLSARRLAVSAASA